MSDFDIVKELAKQVLIISTPNGIIDNFLWDRAKRLAHSAELICQLPDIKKAGFQIDSFCLYSAAYFCNAGLAKYVKEEKTEAKPKPPAVNSNGQRLLDLCATIVEQTLNPHVDDTRIRTINSIIAESGSHFTRIPEAMVLSDARNLDDIGAIGVFNEFRRLISSGKDVCDAVQIWQRKIDYRYWQARIDEGFRFPSVRKIAEQRLHIAEYFMTKLKAETEAEDLKKPAFEVSQPPKRTLRTFPKAARSISR